MAIAVPNAGSFAANKKTAQEKTAQEKAALEFRGAATNVQYNRDKEKTVRFVRLSKPTVTDDTLAILRKFPKLDYLSVVCPQVTDAGIAHIAGLTNLDTVVLSGSGVTDAGLAHLKRLRKLEHLYFANTKITDAGLVHLVGLTSLKTLDLTGTDVSDRGLARLKTLTKLEVLVVDETRITNAGMKHLVPLKKLRLLSLAGCRVDGKTLGLLKPIKSLTQLVLTDCKISAAGISQLEKLKTLKHLELYRVKIAAGDVARLRRALPKTGIHVPPTVVTSQPPQQPNQSSPDTVIGATGKVLPPIQQRLADGLTEPPDFQRHVIPMLSRLGCNGRACHGSFQGQGGFRLSMFGYDFAADHKNLRERVDLKSPAKSLVLNKPTSADEHEGGLRLSPGGWEQQLLKRWIAAGAKNISKTPPRFVRLDVTPTEIVFAKKGETAQLKAVAVWSDGTREDVTCLTRFTTKDEGIVAISPGGKVTAHGGKGDTHVIAFYDNGIVPTPVILPVSELRGVKYARAPTDIDKHVIAKLRKLGIRPSKLCTDEEFLRRVSLDMIGTLPAPAEIRAFVADKSTEKRKRKIDELLNRPAYVMWWTTRLCDLTGSNAGYLGGTEMARPVAEQWQAWIERRVRDNIGWDDIVEGIVLARSRKPGQPYREFAAEQSAFTRRTKPADFAAIGNPMPHFWFRSNVAQPAQKSLSFGHTFLGIRLDCAQCHKHPFDQWSKQDFELFTEFFTRIKARVAPDALEHHKRMQQMLGVPVKLNTAALRRQSYLRIAKEGGPIPWKEITIDPPRAKPHHAKLLGETVIDLNRFADPRTPLMRWLRTEPNHYLAKAFVNRIWANYFNVGIINPPDDLNRANPPSNAALLDALVTDFIAHGYDMKRLHRTIANSHAYQRSWRPNATNKTDERNFSRAILRRLPAEVAVDAMIQSTVNSRTLALSKTLVTKRKIGQHPLSPQTRSIEFSLLVFGKPLRTTNCDCERQDDPTLLQALYLRNDQESIDRLDRKDGWLAELKKKKPTKAQIDDLVHTAYLRILSRQPEKNELADCRKHILKSPKILDGLRDVMWALLNTQEFITNH